jgi:O-antigen ligase
MRRFRTTFRLPRGTVVLLVAAGVVLLASLVARPPLSRFALYFLVLGVGGAGFMLLLAQPALGLVALAALSFTLPFTLGTGTEVRLTAPVFLIAGIAAAWLLTGLHGHSLHLPAARAALPLLLFLASGLVSLLAGRAYWDPLVPQPGNLLLVQLGQWSIYALSAAIFLLAGELGWRGRWLELATWTFLALGSVVVLQFYLRPLGRLLGWSSGDMANRSMFWVWLAALGAGQLFFNRALRPALRLGLVALLATAAFVVWFMQRDWASGWAPFSLAFLTVLLLSLWRCNRAAALLLGAVLVAAAVVLYPTVLAHAGGEAELAMSGGGRAALYRSVLNVVRDHPLLGLGPAAYRQYAFAHWLSVGVGRALYIRPNVSSHNNYIDIYAQQGLVGLALFLWFLAGVGLLGWRLARRFHGDFRDGYVQGCLGGLVATVLAMMLADWFLPFVYNIGFPGLRTSALAWMFLGGLVALEESSSGQKAIDEEMTRPLAESDKR